MARVLALKTSTAAAMSMLILTALRSTEVRLAARSELDVKKGIWTIPVDRVKSPLKDGTQKIPHMVPVGPVELVLLERFPGRPEDPLFPGA